MYLKWLYRTVSPPGNAPFRAGTPSRYRAFFPMVLLCSEAEWKSVWSIVKQEAAPSVGTWAL